jgi:hypothetical protein
MSDSGTKTISDLTRIGGVPAIYDKAIRDSQRKAQDDARKLEQEQTLRRKKP